MNYERIQSYVLNDYLKFERKIYNLFDIRLGRPISVKQLIYFIIAFAILMMLPNIPLIGSLVEGIPFIVRVFMAVGISWLLTDVGTENRPPVKFFVSFISHHWTKSKKESYYKGRILEHQPPITFSRMALVKEPKPQQPPREAQPIKFTKGAVIYDGQRSQRAGTPDQLLSDGKRQDPGTLHTAPIQGSGQAAANT